MERHPRIALIDTLLEDAEHKRTALTHALNARERVEQGTESTHGAPLTIEEEGLKYEHHLWQKVEIGLARCARSWMRSSNWNGNAVCVSNHADTTSIQAGGHHGTAGTHSASHASP